MKEIQSCLAITGDTDIVAVFRQAAAQDERDFLLVVDHENAFAGFHSFVTEPRAKASGIKSYFEFRVLIPVVPLTRSLPLAVLYHLHHPRAR